MFAFRRVAIAVAIVAMTASACATNVHDEASRSEGNDTSAGGDRGATKDDEKDRLPDSAAAGARIDELRARFLTAAALPEDEPHPSLPDDKADKTPVLGPSVVTGFVMRDGAARALLPTEVTSGATVATTTLPAKADAPVRIEDESSRVAVSFTLRGASDAALTVAQGMALYAHALGEADVVHRVDAEGTEDYVVFDKRPAQEEIAYDVDVSATAGLRLVNDTLEFLDPDGTPRLRMAPPFVVDARGGASDAKVALEGCAFDESVDAPWGRQVTAPGASSCVVRVSWRAASYPAMVDPRWTVTGSLATARVYHSATKLIFGRVLIAGGLNAIRGPLSSAELYDPFSRTFAATGSLATRRYRHTATRLLSGKVLVAGGWGPIVGPILGHLSGAELYDPFPGRFKPTGALLGRRSSHTATLLSSGKVLIAGGLASTGSLATAELYDPRGLGTFARTDALGAPRHFHTATLLASGKVLVTGGLRTFPIKGGFASVDLVSAELFVPAGAGLFVYTGALARSRHEHTATLLESGKVLIAGGRDAIGAASVPLATAEVFDPRGAGVFDDTGSLGTARSGHNATLLDSGKVLVSGGTTYGGVVLSSAELFDPRGVGKFARTLSATIDRYDATATLLTSDKVLVAGGHRIVRYPFGPRVVELSRAEIFEECVPAKCHPGANCGTIKDGCGGTVKCGGNCPSPTSCGGGGKPNVCGCTPIKKCAWWQTCGSIPDGCGGFVPCGPDCAAPKTCGGGGPANVCGCTPIKKCPYGKNCGTIPNGCGGVVTCGPACPAQQTCGGDGKDNVCVCTPATTCPTGKDCGTVPDGCGKTINCGSCATGTTCGGGGTPNVCGACTAKTCPEGACGIISNGCGGTLDCGACTSPQTCGGGGTPSVCGCKPKKCPFWKNCGTVPDGCGGDAPCGSADCAAPKTCGGGGYANICGCKPTTCLAAGITCGTIDNGCGVPITCGAPCVPPLPPPP